MSLSCGENKEKVQVHFSWAAMGIKLPVTSYWSDRQHQSANSLLTLTGWSSKAVGVGECGNIVPNVVDICIEVDGKDIERCCVDIGNLHIEGRPQKLSSSGRGHSLA